MDDSTLDLLLARSRPTSTDDPTLPRLAAEAAREAEEAYRRRRATKVGAIVAGCVVGAFSLGIGTAVAEPGIAHWWLWMPENEIEIVTPVHIGGGGVMDAGDYVCTTYVKVLTDGKTADETTTQNLYDARTWLQSVNLADYEDKADALMADVGGSEMPKEFRHANALAMAVMLDLHAQGLNRPGVSVESGGDCNPVTE